MTPSTNLTIEGFFRGLQGEMMPFFGSIVVILIILFLVRWFISKLLADDNIGKKEADSARRWTNRIAGVIVLMMIVGFAVNAATYAINTIPRSGLDGSSIYRDMDANIKKQ